MSIATLVIGLGGTGVLTLRALKRLYGTLPKGERIPAAFLAFDFDRSAQITGDQEGRFDTLSDNEFFYLNPQKLQERLRNIDRGQNGGLAWENLLKWFPDRAKIRIPTSEVEANGASQLRVLGRLGFFENDVVIERMIRVKLNELGSEVDPARLSEERRVMIVSSLAGGTGAGMFIDMAYVARRQLLRPRVYGYVLLPEVFQDVDSGGRIFQNAYACIKELSYLKDQQIRFDAEYEGIPPIHISVAGEEPFARIFLCSGDGFAGADSIKTATHQIAGSILGQLQRTIQEKTLAIASNTLSADSHEEQKKRRTHCFSTVTSTVIPLKEVDLQASIFHKVIEALRNEKELQELYAGDLQEYLTDIVREISTGTTSREREAADKPKEAGEEQPSKKGDEVFPEIEKILKQWNESGEGDARSTTQEIVREITSLLDEKGEEIDLTTKDREGLEERERKLRDLRKLVLDELGSATSNAQGISFLEKSSSFKAFEERIPKTLNLNILGLEAHPTMDQALTRKALYSLLEEQIKGRLFKTEVAESATLDQFKADLAEQDVKLSGRGRYLLQSRTPVTDLVEKLRLQRETLSQAVRDPSFEKNLIRILLTRAGDEVQKFLGTNKDKANRVFKKVQDLWTAGKYQTLESTKTLESLGSRHDEVLKWLRENLSKLLDQSRDLLEMEGSEEEKRQALFDLLKKRLGKDPNLQGKHYILELGSQENAENKIREQLVRSRQRIFEKRTPNPQRKGIALVMLPQGLIWPAGDKETLRRFLEASSTQILAVRSQLEDYDGSRIWIYYEDLFNPPEHVRNIDEYHRLYDSQEFKELFHIDRRFLEEPSFKDVNSKFTSIVVVCGNPDCRENISGLPRTEKICTGCGRMIRNRCGNENCTENALKDHVEGTSQTCPACHGFNHAAWWICTRHGKVPNEIPIDKDRCPVCIEMHQRDPVGYPDSCISVRPDLIDSRVCPHCEDLARNNSKHEPFRIRKDLLPFYLNGVNGHDRDNFLTKVVPKYHLPEKCRCPHCRTILIPVHHRETEQARRRYAPSCEGRAPQ